mgnify:FL=1
MTDLHDLVKPEKPEILHATPVEVTPAPVLDPSLTIQEKAWYQWIPFAGKVVEILARNTIVGKVWDLFRLVFPSSGSGPMNNDLKATITGLVTGILGMLAYFNIIIPTSFVEPIILIGVLVVGFLANRKDVPPAG